MDSKGKEVRDAVNNDRPCSDDWTESMVTYYSYLKNESIECPCHIHAFKIFEDDFEREVIEALLLSGADPVDVKNVFLISERVLEIYAELFFDTQRFSSRLAMISYVEGYNDKFGRDLKLRALHLGPEYVLFKLGNHVPKNQDQQLLIKRFFMASAYRAMEANFNPLGSPATKAATDHAKLMIKAFDCLKELFSQSESAQQTFAKILTTSDVESPTISNRQISEKDII